MSGLCRSFSKYCDVCSFILNALAVYEDAPEVWSLLLFIGVLVIGCVITTFSCFI